MLARNGDMCVHSVGAGEQWRHGCVLVSNGDMGACWQEMETWVCAGWVLVSNGDMGACWPQMETCVCIRLVLVGNGTMGVF